MTGKVHIHNHGDRYFNFIFTLIHRIVPCAGLAKFIISNVHKGRLKHFV